MAVNLGMLGVFKYLNFFVASFAELLDRFGMAPNTPLLKVLLPVTASVISRPSSSTNCNCTPRDLSSAAIGFAPRWPPISSSWPNTR